MKKLSLALIAGSACLATSAFADTTTLPNNHTASRSNIYVSADLGYGNLATPDKDATPAGECGVIEATHNTGNVAGGVHLGYQSAVKPDMRLGAEIGYEYNGRAKYTEKYELGTSTTKISSKDFHLLATGTYLFNNGLDIFAKAGAARITQNQKNSGYMEEPLNEQNIVKYKPMIAGGIGYQHGMVNVFAQYTHIFGKNAKNFEDIYDSTGSFNKVASVDTFKLGAAVNIKV